MIRSFRDSEAEKIFRGETSRKLPSDTLGSALRRLQYIDSANQIGDLRVPVSNRLEKLRGDRAGKWSIRINDQWRICFEWTSDNNAADVEIVDYH
jgi:proteic killer suppression protein